MVFPQLLLTDAQRAQEEGFGLVIAPLFTIKIG